MLYILLMINMDKKTAVIVGAGLGGLAAACYLAKDGIRVTVLEKNDAVGGRASVVKQDGFTFDMGPSWYWMPEIFEKFFNDFDKKSSDYYELIRINPSYRVFWSKNDVIDMPVDLESLYKIFESLEEGSSKKLKVIMDEGKEMLEIALNKFLYRHYNSILDLVNPELIVKGLKLKVFKSLKSLINSNFKNEKLRQLCTWQSLFLGATPENLPSLYSFMLHVDFKLGTWYPKRGIYELPKAMYKLAIELGVDFVFNSPVTHIDVVNGIATGVKTSDKNYLADNIIVNADYHFAETQLLDAKWQSYREPYWDKADVAPSALLYYVGFNKKLKNVIHHNYYFCQNWEKHFDTLFKNPDLPPEDPAFYFNITSFTDQTVAPDGMDGMFILVPVASNLKDIDIKRDEIFNKIIEKIQILTDNTLTDSIITKKIISQKDQISLFNSYKGTCFGLAQTLLQTASFRPKIKAAKLKIFTIVDISHIQESECPW